MFLQYTSDEQFLRPITKTAQLIWKYTQLYFYIFSYSSNYGIESMRDVITKRPDIRGELFHDEIVNENKYHGTIHFHHDYKNNNGG